MKRIDEYINGITSTLREFNEPALASDMAVETARPLSDLIVELNTKGQLQQSGTDGTGLPIKPDYSAFTIRYKRRKGQPVNRVTLKDTGAFHDSFKALFRSGQIEIVATDPKTGELMAKYGSDILGLDDASLNTLADKLRPLIIDEFRKRIMNVQ